MHLVLNYVIQCYMDNMQEIIIGDFQGKIYSNKGSLGVWTITNKNIRYKEKNGYELVIHQKDILEYQKNITKNSIIIKFESINNGVKAEKSIIVIIKKSHYNDFIKALEEVDNKFELKEANKLDIYFIILIICMFWLVSCVIYLYYY